MLTNNEFNISETDSLTIPGLVPNNDISLNSQRQLLSSGETQPEDDETLLIASQLIEEIEVNNIDGTRGRDNLVGTDGSDIITGFQGGDTLTGGEGSDTFVYTGTRDRRDIITDFEVCSDIIDLSDVLDAIGFTGDDPVASGYVGLRIDGEDAIVTIDPDGPDGRAIGVSFITLRELGSDAIENENFLTEVLNGCSSADTDSPIISAELLNDTGADDTDNITSDPTIIGTVTDASEIVSLTAGFNETSVEDFVDITAEVSESGTFELDQELLEEILGDTLTNDTYTLKLQGTDEHDNSSSILELEFTLDLDVEAPVVSAELLNDTGADDTDNITSDPTIIGTVTDAGEIVSLTAGFNETSVEDFVDITVEVSEDGSLELDQELLEEILGDTLTDDIYTLKLQAKDENDNSSSVIELEFTLDTEAPEISAELLNDTGADDTDNITSDPTIIGQVTDNNDISSLVVGFDQQNLDFELKDNLDSTGNFELTKELLEEIKGEELEDGTYVLYFQAIDSSGNNSEISEYSFTLDATTELTIELDSEFDSPPIGDGITEAETVSLIGQTEPNQTVTLEETGEIVTADDEGKFEFVEIELEIGENIFNATVKDDAGNQENVSLTVERVEKNDIILLEENNFNTTSTQTLEFSEIPKQLNIKLTTLDFDTTDTDSINDALEIALVDEEGQSLVHTIGNNKQAFFNKTESQEILLAPGVTYDESDKTIVLNLTDIPAETTANLVFRLINNDSDTTTTATIEDFYLTAAPDDVETPVATEIEGDFTPTPLTDTEISSLTDISTSFPPLYKHTSYNEQTKQLIAEYAITNQSQYPVKTPLLVAIANISDPTVTVRDPDGFTPEGIPYYNISDLVSDNKLNPEETTETRDLVFYNPDGVQFDYELQVLGRELSGPAIESEPDIEIIAGQSYNYDVNATHPEDDSLTYELLVAPEGMSIDAETGLILWDTETEDIANHAITVKVTDSEGLEDIQTFTLSVIETPPNRPPNFTSTPEVDAWINQVYNYDADATDPDNDSLTYDLIIGPEGMTVNPDTGEIEWTPPPVLVLGDTVLGRINLPGDEDEFSFSGIKGQRIYFDPLLADAGGTWYFDVIGPDGDPVVDSDLTSNQIITLEETGNYRIVVDAGEDYTGSYGFSTIDLGMIPVAAFDKVIEGSLSPGSEDDIYRFTGNEGQKLFFDKLSSSGGSLNWILYGPDNTVVDNSDDFSDLELYLPSDGEYMLALRGSAGFDGKIEYSFEIITPEEITTPISLGSNDEPHSIEGEIGEKGEEDFYTFEGEAGQRIYFDRLFYDGTIKTFIYSPSDTHIPSSNFNFNRDDATAPITLNEDGTYQVKVDATGEDLGTYSFSIKDPGLATQIEVDTAVSGSLNPGLSAHFYEFEGIAGQRLYLDTAGGTSRADWTLYDSGNNQISNANLNTDMELVLTDTDTYTLRIRGNNNNPVDYSFEIITPDTLEETLTIGETIEGEIGEKGERDIYTFTGNQGQRLFLDTLINSSNNRATIRTPSGSEMNLWSHYNWTWMSSDISRNPIILPEDGTYELTVDGWLEPTDEYSFRLLDAASAPVLEMNTPTEGIFNPGTSIQFYQFDGTEGDRIYFESEGNSPSSYWRLYSPENKLLTPSSLNPWYLRALNTDFEYVLPGDGTYYLMLRGEGAEETPYNIQLVPTDAPDTSFDFNSWIDAEIEDLGDRDVYTFSGEVGQTLYFDPRAGNTSITAQIHSPSGQLIFNGNTSSDSPPFTLTEPGTYRVSIDSSKDVTGDYSFRVTDSTTALELGEATSGSVSKGETVLYQFSAEAGQRLEFDSLMSVSGADWVLYAPTTSESKKLDIGSANLNTDFTQTLPVDGNYILAVRNKTDSDVSYEFQINDVTPTPESNEGPINSELETLRSGQISVVGEVDTYEFSVETPTAIFFDGLPSDPNIMARLYAPDGTTFIFETARTENDSAVDHWFYGYYRPYQLTQTGDYKLEVYGNGQATGDYNFKLVDLAAASSLELDTITDAPLDSNETTVYKFDGQAGQKLWFDGLNTTNPSVTARLLNPEGDRIADITNWHGDLQLPSLEADGEHYLLLQSNNSSDTTASFQLLDMSGASILERDANQETTLNPWESLVYKFEGEAGEKVWIDGLDASHSRVKAWLYNSSGRKIGENNYQWPSLTGLPNDIFLETLEADGEYYLVLESKNNENTTTTFRLLDDDSATPLTFDTNVSGSFNPTGKEAFLYKFTGEEGQRLYFDTQNNNADEKIWKVYAPSGVELPWEYLKNDLEQVLPASGEYLLALYTNNNAAGTLEDYEFRVVTPDPQETSIAIGDTIEDQIEELGQQNTYTFTGTEGQRLWFDGLTGAAITAKLYSPANQELFSLAMPKDNGPLTLNETGTYRLLVDGKGASVSDYSFRFLDIDEDAIAVSLDEEISGTFGPSLRELHLYDFEADEGEYVFFDREKGTYNQWSYPNHYTVYGNDNEIIWNHRLDRDSETSLPYTGEYVLAFRPHVSNPGSEYSLQIVTPEFETTPLTFGETVNSQISEQGEWDTYTFTGTPGQILYFDSLDSSTPTTMKAKLIAPSGKEVWSQSVKDDRVPFALDEAGGYELIIDVDANNDLHDSNYSFRLLDFADATTKNLDSGEFQVDVGPSDRDTNFYNFTGVEGQHIFFDVLEGSNYSYALYDRYGKNVFAALNADKEVKLPYTGEYFLGFHSSVTRDDIYKLKAVLLPEEGITSITFGEAISNNISLPGERDTYSFEGVEGQILYFDSWENTSVNIDGKLIAPSGKEVWSQDVAKDYKPFVLSETGTYIFEVDGKEDNDETGSYSFQFFNFAEVPELTLDTTISGDFEIGKRETILHRFSGNQGDYFYFDSVVGHSSDDYILYNADEEVFEKQLNSDNELELPEDGEYVLALISDGAEPDNYELKIVTPELTTTPLNLGEVINSNISESGEQDFYSFEGAVGQKLFFDSVEGNSNIRVRLFSPTEIKVTDKHLGQNWEPFTLTENGTYRLEIDANDNKVGDYGFVLSDRSSTTRLELDTPTTGTLELGNDVDLYHFDGKQGQILNFDLDAERWSGANWVLYTPDNKVLSQPNSRQPDFKATLSSDGLYTLAIAGISSEPVSYGFEVTEEIQTSVINEGLNVVHSGTITEGSVDEYTFTANAGTTIFYDSHINTPRHINVFLTAPDGETKVINGNDVNSNLLLSLEQTGEYNLQVYSSSNTTTDDYQFQILEFPQDSTSTTFNPLELNSIVTGTANPSLEAELYSFEAVSGQQILFNQIAGHSERATLYSPSNSPVLNRFLHQGDSGIVTLNQDGIYHLLIQGRVATPQDYSFQMLDFDSGSDLNFNVPTDGFLPSGQQGELYKFTGTEGQHLFFESIKGTTTNNWKLYGPDNNIVDSKRLDRDFEVELPSDGNYTLYIEGGDSANPVEYEFRVIDHDDSIDIITPGTGEIGSNEEENQAIFPVQIQVEDENGGTDVQEYNIRVGADPDNAAPAIISTPPNKYGLNQKAYRYQIQAIDPDGDELRYQLLDSPDGAIVSTDTGEVVWFPESVLPGDTATFTVEVADGRGGTDSQTFTVEVEGALGKIQGAVFEDLNNNGYRDTTLVEGDNPDIVFVIDVSGSTGGNYVNWETADIESVADEPMGILGMEMATAIALSEQLILQGRGDTAKIGVIPFHRRASILDMNPATPEIDLYTTPLADMDNNGVGDLRQVLNRLSAGGGTSFTPALEVAKGWLESLPGDPNIIFLSDGFGGVDLEIVEELNADNVNITAFGIGSGAGMGQLQKIDPDAIQVTDPREVIEIFSGWDDRYSTEPFMEGITVYLDLNDNGELDEGEPTQITQKDEGESLLGTTPFYFTFDNLLPGEYKVRQVVPNGYEETAPSTGVWTDTITVEGETIGHLFGLHEIGDPPNTAPVFISTAPTESIEVGRTFQYTAFATDGDADILTFDLTLRPEGMTVDGETGTLVWQPTEEQVGSFNVILRVSDGKGGQDLQYIGVDVVPQNNAPVFTSTLPDNANAKVGELFNYQAVALDADGDTLTYSLSDNAPSGISIDSSTGLLEWTAPQSLLDSTVEFEIEVTDDRGGIAVQEINLKVNPAPVLPPLNLETVPDTAAIVNSLYSYQLPDGLGLNLTTAPDGMTVDDNGLLEWTPDETQLGIHDIVIEVTDTDGNTVVQSWQLEVGNQGINRSPVIVTTTDPEFENQPPEILSTPRISTRSGKTYFYQLEAIDPDSDALNFELVNAPSGMEITQGGLLSWSPTVADFGYHDVSVAVGDGLWQTVQSWDLFVSDRTTNESPSIISVPNTVTNTERLYQYQLEGFDGDGDRLLWSLDEAPSGMVIDPGTGMLTWQPTVEQIGSHSVSVRVTDTEGAYVGQVFDLRVTGINTPPEIVSIPITSASATSNYSYQVVATDPENDRLEFGLGIHPEGMRVDVETGAISWSPADIGSFEVEVLVTDAQGATNRQSYTVEVGEGATNGAPAIVSSPVYIADVGSAYSYDVEATDPDGDDLSYQLIAGPDGMTLVPETGVVSWSDPVLGTHNVVVGASDGSLGAAQGFVLTVIENAAPTFDDASVPPGVAVPGKVYSYDVLATDPNGERLSYGLDDDSVALGMELDEFGRLRWIPTVADAGSHGVTITVTDGAGESVEQSFDVTVMADTVAPVVELRPLSGYFRSGDDYLAELGSEVTFVVSATDDVGVTGLRLTVDGEAVAVDGNGLATVPFESVGAAVVSALAVDAAGNEGSAAVEFGVRDFSDETVPVAILDDAISDDLITAPVDVLGTVTDDGDVEYVLEVAPVAGGEFVEIGRGDTAVDGGALGVFDPSLLQNDTYVLRLTATDGGGNSSTDEVIVDVAGELKLGNFRLSFTDLEIPVSGIPITVTRTYDSLNASQRDDFGYGWRLEFRDMDLRTSVRERTAQEELLGVHSPFSDGERVYVTLPGGERTGFTFEPRSHRLNGFLGDPNAFMYHPEFVADDGSDLVLRVRDANLIRKAGTNEFVQNGSGVAYNPADVRFGGVYELVTQSGVVYEIDAVSGDLLTVTDRNGNMLTYSDSGIVSSTGVEVSFERDAAGRIVGVVDPEGNRIGYEYDVNGDLVGVTDREDNTTEFVYDEDDRPHYLEEIVDPLGRSGVRTEYDEQGRLQKMLDVNGEAVELVYDPDNSTQTVRDVFGNATTYVYDGRGNVVTEVDAVGKVVRRTYDGDNNVLTETVVTDESGPDGWTTTYTYDARGNKLTETDPLGNTTRSTYNAFGQLLTYTNSLGNTTSYTYDPRGNMLSVTDAEGHSTTYTYDLRGNPLSMKEGPNRVTRFEYDQFGNRTRKIDALGNETTYTYDSSGNVLTETTKLTTSDGVRTLTTTNTYDDEGNKISELDAEGGLTQYEYDVNGNQTAVIDALRTEMTIRTI